MTDDPLIHDVQEDTSIRRHEIATRLTSVERRLMERFSDRQDVIVCVGNIGAGKSSLVKFQRGALSAPFHRQGRRQAHAGPLLRRDQ